jgi:UDP-N-acetylmuramoyl-tripeptide--D-alanyl-D-alanine ligase
MQIRVRFICSSTGGKLIYGDPNMLISGVCIDSNHVLPGAVFFALKGQRHDGHDFAEEALNKGASAVVISDPARIPDYPSREKAVILVKDTRKALQDLAAQYRIQFNLTVVAVTGSVGKTTTKDLVALCLQTKYKTLKTEGNLNNEIGLPLTVLNLTSDFKAAVLELAMRARGEISQLSSIAKPNIALITNVGPVHLETLGNIENIARAKCEVLESIPPEGFGLINGDNRVLLEEADKYPCTKYTFGYNKGCDFRIKTADIDDQNLIIKAEMLGKEDMISFPIPSKRLAPNVVAAMGLSYLLGLDLSSSKKALMDYRPSGNRLNLTNLAEGGLVINDTYNANPLSMALAIETAKEIAGGRKLVAVLGDMFELGEYETQGHIEVGRKVAEAGFNILIAIGKRSEAIAKGALESGMMPENIFHCLSKEDGLQILRRVGSKKDVTLFKASRGMQMETLLEDWLH